MAGAKVFNARLLAFMPLDSTAAPPVPLNAVERGLADLWTRTAAPMSPNARRQFRSAVEDMIRQLAVGAGQPDPEPHPGPGRLHGDAPQDLRLGPHHEPVPDCPVATRSRRRSFRTRPMQRAGELGRTTTPASPTTSSRTRRRSSSRASSTTASWSSRTSSTASGAGGRRRQRPDDRADAAVRAHRRHRAAGPLRRIRLDEKTRERLNGYVEAASSGCPEYCTGTAQSGALSRIHPCSTRPRPGAWFHGLRGLGTSAARIGSLARRHENERLESGAYERRVERSRESNVSGNGQRPPDEPGHRPRRAIWRRRPSPSRRCRRSPRGGCCGCCRGSQVHGRHLPGQPAAELHGRRRAGQLHQRRRPRSGSSPRSCASCRCCAASTTTRC